MVEQKKVDLNLPLDAETVPTLRMVTLEPYLSEASLILHGDYYGQLRSKLTKYFYWHPASVIFIVLSVLGFATYKVRDYIQSASSFFDLLGYFLYSNDFKFQLSTAFPVLMCCFATVGLTGYLIGDDFKTISDNLTKRPYIEQLYGFDLRQFAKIKQNIKLSQKEIKLLENGRNSQLIIYRESPIGVITLKVISEKSTLANFYVNITSINVRRVFATADFETILIEWAISRARELYQEFIKGKSSKKAGTIHIGAEGYTFDKALPCILLKNNFIKIADSFQLNSFKSSSRTSGFLSSLHHFFGIKRELFELIISPNKPEEDEASNVFNSKIPATAVRKRKNLQFKSE